ncbi:GNAT family N-acetyltransferase [Roseibium sp. CAU 1637]|uniref:GNAT family N-acetyltransferase n=1 Tax=Roseibium limicola TaxID=2816037 RepID=A0A939EMI4_9HYPH|nr:GNAT family protein [Roseibium limicola]MBO0344028.1 GNAT family N-acetyltransferase [Roseibium limicola]
MISYHPVTPKKTVLEGTFVRLEPLNVAAHSEDLFVAASVEDRAEKYRYLAEAAPEELQDVTEWAEAASRSADPLFYAIVDKRTGKAVGRQAFLRIDAANGVIEVGHIYWGPAMARSRAATEVMYLCLTYVFEELKYRRFEWKCNNENQPSKVAAGRFGFNFEGIFRQHMIQKGLNRDTAWFAIIDSEWAVLKPAYESWLAPENFDAEGMQRTALSQLTAAALGR